MNSVEKFKLLDWLTNMANAYKSSHLNLNDDLCVSAISFTGGVQVDDVRKILYVLELDEFDNLTEIINFHYEYPYKYIFEFSDVKFFSVYREQFESFIDDNEEVE